VPRKRFFSQNKENSRKRFKQPPVGTPACRKWGAAPAGKLLTRTAKFQIRSLGIVVGEKLDLLVETQRAVAPFVYTKLKENTGGVSWAARRSVRVGSLLCTSNLLYAYISIQVHFTTCRIVRLNERRRVSMRVAALSILSRDQLRAGALLPMRFAVRAIHPNFQKPHVAMGGIMAVGCWNERESRSTGGVSASLLLP
jgi:hypothetical protein